MPCEVIEVPDHQRLEHFGTPCTLTQYTDMSDCCQAELWDEDTAKEDVIHRAYALIKEAHRMTRAGNKVPFHQHAAMRKSAEDLAQCVIGLLEE